MGSFCYFCIFLIFFKFEKFSDFSLYKEVVGFLHLPEFKTLAFFTSLSMLQTCFIFEMQSYKRTRICLMFNINFNKRRTMFIEKAFELFKS